MMANWLLVGLGASLGALGRYHFTNLYKKFRPEAGYQATLLINLSGALLLGMFGAATLTARWYAFLGVGLCGGWTTFSTLNSELGGQVASQKFRQFGSYFVLTYALGLPLCALGWWLGHRFF
ncbi:fluoride efflux transporter FluC [Lapidilactobacillus gannanensis]|uniref:Fluoride-specific ion channel FluC n=1 Tax=Lapidilactobacillus gannanensis TaxID=2486002 RepID=A0ABW4BJY2_9LACO|nr:CrcB family protein [Lapidilactobacillus gannanensis]